MRLPFVYSQDDPLSAALRPPSNETMKERALRLKAEAEAKRVSDQIDEELQQERNRLRGNKDDIKLLLLGQAESGKSTFIKQFQLMFKQHSIEQEHISWKTVIYYNVIRSLKHILTTLEAWGDTAEDRTGYSPNPHSRRLGEFSDQPCPLTSLLDPGASQIVDLRRKLVPLVRADELLADYLHEVKNGRNKQDRVQDSLVQDVAHMLRYLEKDIKELWDHTTVKGFVAKRRLKLDEGSEFFLEHISRVADPDYVPTTDDILHARVPIMGVQEHMFDVDIHGRTVTCHLYDVGGARGQRHSWVPYFDDINAIIFVVPVSDIDQFLEEDPRTNRIEDSLQLFTQICSNRLLKKATVILIFNKIGLLRAKLDGGLEVRKYITSFGERSNDYDTVIKYLRAHFLQVHRRNNENLYTHFTNVIDTRMIQCIIAHVRDSIFREYLRSIEIDNFPPRTAELKPGAA